MSTTRGLITAGLQCLPDYTMPFEHQNSPASDFIVERAQPIDCLMDSECTSQSSQSTTYDHTATRGTSKRRKTSDDINNDNPLEVSVKVLRLPEPCPIPTTFSEEVLRAIENDNITGLVKDRLQRQIGQFYYGLCPRPLPEEYTIMAKTACNKFPQLQDKKTTRYWVSLISTSVCAECIFPLQCIID